MFRYRNLLILKKYRSSYIFVFTWIWYLTTEWRLFWKEIWTIFIGFYF